VCVVSSLLIISHFSLFPFYYFIACLHYSQRSVRYGHCGSQYFLPPLFLPSSLWSDSLLLWLTSIICHRREDGCAHPSSLASRLHSPLGHLEETAVFGKLWGIFTGWQCWKNRLPFYYLYQLLLYKLRKDNRWLKTVVKLPKTEHFPLNRNVSPCCTYISYYQILIMYDDSS